MKIRALGGKGNILWQSNVHWRQVRRKRGRRADCRRNLKAGRVPSTHSPIGGVFLRETPQCASLQARRGERKSRRNRKILKSSRVEELSIIDSGCEIGGAQ